MILLVCTSIHEIIHPVVVDNERIEGLAFETEFHK